MSFNHQNPLGGLDALSKIKTESKMALGVDGLAIAFYFSIRVSNHQNPLGGLDALSKIKDRI